MCSIPAHPEVLKRFPNACRAHDTRISGDTRTTTASAQTHTQAWLPACLHRRRRKGQSQEAECLSSGVRAVPRSESRAGIGSEPETKKKKRGQEIGRMRINTPPQSASLLPLCPHYLTPGVLSPFSYTHTHTHAHTGYSQKGSYERLNTSSHSPA